MPKFDVAWRFEAHGATVVEAEDYTAAEEYVRAYGDISLLATGRLFDLEVTAYDR